MAKTLKLKGTKWLKVYILVDVLPFVKKTKISLFTYKCNDLQHFPDYTETYNVKNTRNEHCNFEYSKKGKINCRWMTLTNNNSNEFQIAQYLTTSCDKTKQIRSGLKYLHEKHFIAFQSAKNNNKKKPTITYIVSPILKRTSSNILLSFYYQLRGNSTIRVYLVGKNYDTDFIENYANILSEISNSTIAKWTEKQVKLSISPRYSEYHVSIMVFQKCSL